MRRIFDFVYMVFWVVVVVPAVLYWICLFVWNAVQDEQWGALGVACVLVLGCLWVARYGTTRGRDW